MLSWVQQTRVQKSFGIDPCKDNNKYHMIQYYKQTNNYNSFHLNKV